MHSLGAPKASSFLEGLLSPPFTPQAPKLACVVNLTAAQATLRKDQVRGRGSQCWEPRRRKTKQRDGLLFLKPVRRLENALGLNIYFAKDPRNHGKLQLSQHLIFIMARSLSKLLSSSSKTGEEAAPWGCVGGGRASLRTSLGRLEAVSSQLLAHRTRLGLSLARVTALESDSGTWHLEGSQWLSPSRPISGPW